MKLQYRVMNIEYTLRAFAPQWMLRLVQWHHIKQQRYLEATKDFRAFLSTIIFPLVLVTFALVLIHLAQGILLVISSSLGVVPTLLICGLMMLITWRNLLKLEVYRKFIIAFS